jgi:hypothetical protein
MEQEPVCATGKGSAGCNMPDKGCTYTNGCMARCVYGATVSYMGACTHPGAMSIAEASGGGGTGQGRGAGRTDCKCPFQFEPVCATVPACTIPGEAGWFVLAMRRCQLRYNPYMHVAPQSNACCGAANVCTQVQLGAFIAAAGLKGCTRFEIRNRASSMRCEVAHCLLHLYCTAVLCTVLQVAVRMPASALQSVLAPRTSARGPARTAGSCCCCHNKCWPSDSSPGAWREQQTAAAAVDVACLQTGPTRS